MRRLLAALAIVLAGFFSVASPAFAVNPDEMLSDPALEQRARTISAELRCLVCQNESIDVSDADLARDLRLLVRRRLKQGETNKQVISYIVSRYGEFVLLKPRLESKTLLLWGAPLFVFLCGAAAMALHARGQAGRSVSGKLSEEEEARLRILLDDPNDKT